MSVVTLSHAGTYDWVASSVGQPLTQALTEAKESVSSMIGSPVVTATSSAPAIAGKGSRSCSDLPLPSGATIDLGFSPEGTAEEKVLEAIREETHRTGERSILVAAYEFTSWPVAKALVAARDAGVKVAVVVDAKENVKKASKAQFLVDHGIPVRQDNRLDMVHDKTLVLGGETVELGSFNFTAAAASAKHAENALVLRHAPNVAECYIAHWRRLWDQSTPM